MKEPRIITEDELARMTDDMRKKGFPVSDAFVMYCPFCGTPFQRRYVGRRNPVEYYLGLSIAEMLCLSCFRKHYETARRLGIIQSMEGTLPSPEPAPENMAALDFEPSQSESFSPKKENNEVL